MLGTIIVYSLLALGIAALTKLVIKIAILTANKLKEIIKNKLRNKNDKTVLMTKQSFAKIMQEGIHDPNVETISLDQLDELFGDNGLVVATVDEHEEVVADTVEIVNVEKIGDQKTEDFLKKEDPIIIGG